MYLPRTRAKMSRQGGGDILAAPDQLEKLKADGYQLEYWQARLSPGQPATAATEIVFDRREPVTPNVVTAEATQVSGTWSVTLSRPLAAPAAFSSIVPGQTYHIAFAIHAGQTATRFHYVSFERSLVLNSGNADFVAAKR
jgi:cytochrome c-type protein NapC